MYSRVQVRVRVLLAVWASRRLLVGTDHQVVVVVVVVLLLISTIT